MPMPTDPVPSDASSAVTADAVRWQRLSMLFDELVDAADAERRSRLDALRLQDPTLATELEAMLHGDARRGPLDRSESGLGPFAVNEPVARNEPLADRSGEPVGVYRLLRRIGRGGMGEVYLAERVAGDFEQRVAIKLLKRGMDSEALLARFGRERRILAQLQHPNIARLLDGGLALDGTPYFSMELVDGSSIVDHAREHALDPRQRAQLLLQAADAVAYAQSRLVVHRDIKPSNLMVDREGRVRVLDFGIAKLLGDSEAGEPLTDTGVGILTPAYAAPEQMRGEPITTATDVYALGGVLFELLTGRPPHSDRGNTPAAWLRALQHESVDRPSALLRDSGQAQLAASYPDLPRERLLRELRGDLDLIVTTALQADPGRRYASAAELAQDLRRWLDGRPIAARPDTAGYRLRRFVARHRLGVGSASAVLLALIAGFGIALWQAGIAREQARRADAEAARSQLVKDFVLSLYGEQDPVARAQAQARSPRELVAAGVERARQQFADEPALRSDLLTDLGEVQTALGDAPAAQLTLADALREREERLGAQHPQTAITRRALGATQMAINDRAAARDSLASALQVLDVHPEHALEAARAELALAYVVLTSDGPADALPHVERAHRRFVSLRGDDDPETLTALGYIGTLLEQLDRLPEAQATFERTLAGLERSLGPDHARLVVPGATLADILRRTRQYDAARALLERVITIARTQFGDGHPSLGSALMRYGDLLRRIGDYPAAEVALDEAAACFPADAPQLGQIALFRGGVLRAQGRDADAAEAYADAHARFLAALGPDSLFPWMASVQHAQSLGEIGQEADAEALLRTALARLQSITGDDSMDSANAEAALGSLLARQRRDTEALALLERAGDTLAARLGTHDANTLGARVEHVRVQRRLGQIDAAIATLDALLADMPDEAGAAAVEAPLRLERALFAEQQKDAARLASELARLEELDTGSFDDEAREQWRALQAGQRMTD